MFAWILPSDQKYGRAAARKPEVDLSHRIPDCTAVTNSDTLSDSSARMVTFHVQVVFARKALSHICPAGQGSHPGEGRRVLRSL
jgi:hypothetical protein